MFQRVGDRLDKLSQRTGVSVEALSQLGFAAEQSGSSLGAVETGIRSMQRSITDLGRGLSTQRFAFEQLGLSFKDIEQLNPEQQFTLIADRISQIEDPTKRVALSMQIFGRAGQELQPLLAQGASGIAALRAEAERLGITIDTETAKSAAEFGDAINRLRQQMKALAVNIGGALAPALTRAAGFFSAFGPAVIDFAKSNRQLILTIAAVGAGLVALGGTLVVVGTTIGLVGFAITGLGTIIGALLSPLGLLAVGTIAAGVAMLRFTDAGAKAIEFLKDRFGGLLKTASATFKGIGQAAAAGDVELAMKILWAGVELATYEGIDAVMTLFYNFKADYLTASSEIAAGTLDFLTKSWAGWRQGFAVTVGFFKTQARSVVGDLREAINLSNLQLVKAINRVQGALDPKFDVALNDRAAEAEFTKAQNKEIAARKAALGKIKAEEDKRIKEIRDEVAQKEADIQQALRDELAAIADGKKADGERIKAKLKGLKDELELLNKQAEAAAAFQKARDLFYGVVGSKKKFTGYDGEIEDVDPFKDPIANQLRNAGRTLGVTSSFDIRSVTNGDDGIARIQVTVQQIKKKLDDIDAHIGVGVNNGFAIS